MSKVLTRDQQYMVYTYYVGAGFQLGTAYISPLPLSVRGSNDRHSSFNIYEVNGNLRWKDFGGGKDLRGDAIEFIIHMQPEIHNLPENRRFKEAYRFFKERIENSRVLDSDLILKQASISKNTLKNKNPIPKYDQDFRDFELNYWYRDLLITKEFLMNQRVHACRGIDWGNGKTTMPSVKGDPAFLYDLSENGDMSSWKMYRPLTTHKRFKWKSWNLSCIPFEGYHLLPEFGERLLFTSGRKDGFTALMLDEIFKGYFDWHVGNPTGENAFRSIIPYIPELRKRFDWIGILFDGDETGIKAANQFHELTGFDVLHLEYPIGTKDMTEVVEEKSYQYLFDIITKCTNSTPFIK